MSRHAGGAFFGFADGACHFISDDIDQLTYRALGSISGDEPLGDY
jgi:hypothetical protein